MTESPFYVELKKSRLLIPQRWRFRARGRNNEILVTSEFYRDKQSAVDTILLLWGPAVEVRER